MASRKKVVPQIMQTSVPSGPPSFMPPRHRLMVLFECVTQDGQQIRSRVFVDDVVDIRTQRDVETVEKAIIERAEGTIVSAMITDWKKLEG